MTEEQPAPPGPEGPFRASSGATARVVRQEINRGTKVIRVADNGRWSDEAEEHFLEELAASCNVRAAAAAAGFSTTAVYKRRMRWPGFAAAWAEAVEQGYARLEAMLVQRATDSLRGEPLAGAPSTSSGQSEEESTEPRLVRMPMTVAEALNLLRLHRAEVRGGKPQNYRAMEKAPDMDEIRASILRKIEAIERADALKESGLSQRRGGAEEGK